MVEWMTGHVARLASSIYTSDKILYKLEPYYVNVVRKRGEEKEKKKR
jgi:hypothetical protein